ncbi:MAG: Rpn family recombination-promoting nuclease/putative transposase, partial [Spirochaetes bacterium]|nr:Rpn family recombination-promoting nuclease/putative transposase [Spirochaetota bacterium]
MDVIKNIHDKFFKELFSQKENVKDFLKVALPSGIVSEINFDKTEPEGTEYIDKEYKKTFSDIVVKTKLKRGGDAGDAVIYILFEHKSYRDKRVMLQLLSYMLKMWKRDMDNKRSLRVIIPLVFYHGRKKWDIHLNFRDNFDCEENLKEYLEDYKYILFDTNDFEIGSEKEKRLTENVNLLTGIVLMKNVYYNNYSNLRYIFDLWAKTGFIKKRELIIFFTRYMVETEDIDAGKIAKLLKDKLREEDIMPTLAQRWLEEGKLEGKLLNQQEIVIKQLDKKFGLKEQEKDFIRSITDREKLDRVIEEILFSESKEEL